MRFSIRFLLLFVFLIAIILAAMASERPGTRYKRIASIEFCPAGDQIAVSVLEKNGYLQEEPCVFHRTISIVKYPSLETGSVVRSDKFRCETSNEIFWHSQTDVIHTETHLVFLNQNRSSLMLYDLESGDLREWARYVGGEIWSFSASADARLIVVSGRQVPPVPAGEAVTLDGETYYLDRDSGLELIKKNEDSFSMLAFVSELGIDEKELIMTPLDEERLSYGLHPNSNSLGEPVDEDSDEDGLAGRLRVVIQHADTDPVEKPALMRYLIVPRDESKPGDSDSIASAVSIFSWEFDPVSLDSIGTDNYGPIYNKQLARLYDFATSEGSCRFAIAAENNRLMLNIITDQIPSTDNIDLRIPSPTDSESVVALSKTGDLVALSHGRDVKLIETSKLITGYRPGMIDEMKQSGSVFLYTSQPLSELKNQGLVTAVAFSRNGRFLVVGDDQGFISMFDVASGELVKQERATGRMSGLPRLLLFPMLAVWLILVAVMYFGRSVNVHEPEISEQGVQVRNP